MRITYLTTQLQMTCARSSDKRKYGIVSTYSIDIVDNC